MNRIILSGCVAVGGWLAAWPSQAGLVFTIENPGVQASTVPGVITEDFNSGSPGPFSGGILWNGSQFLGTLSPGGAKVAPDAYGGAYGSQYYAVGAQSGSTSSTLTLSAPQDYFGMWWPAGDRQNQLNFYDGATLLGSYRVADIIPHLSPAYYGNPNYPADQGEPFVYLDFTTTGSSTITSVSFLNDSTGSGFEMDNFSVLGTPITPPGNGLPDGGSTAALLAGVSALLAVLGRKPRA